MTKNGVGRRKINTREDLLAKKRQRERDRYAAKKIKMLTVGHNGKSQSEKHQKISLRKKARKIIEKAKEEEIALKYGERKRYNVIGRTKRDLKDKKDLFVQEVATVEGSVQAISQYAQDLLTIDPLLFFKDNKPIPLEDAPPPLRLIGDVVICPERKIPVINPPTIEGKKIAAKMVMELVRLANQSLVVNRMLKMNEEKQRNTEPIKIEFSGDYNVIETMPEEKSNSVQYNTDNTGTKYDGVEIEGYAPTIDGKEQVQDFEVYETVEDRIERLKKEIEKYEKE